MQSLARNGFTAEQVRKALHGTTRVRFRYLLLDRYNQVRGELKTVREASISHNALADIKRTARFVLEDTGEVNWLSDRIQPWMDVWVPENGGGWAEFPLGVFLLSTPRRTVHATGTILREVEAYDLTQVLQDDKITSRYLIPAGTNFVDAVRVVLEGAGITQFNLVPTTKTMPADREWDPGTPRLRIINDLLEAINYESLWFDENGVAIAAPYVEPAQAPSEYDYRDDDESVIDAEQVEEERDLFSIPNKWVLVVSQPDRPALRSEYTNDNGNSPLSTVNRGRVIVDYREVDAADQETLDALARRLANEASQVFEHIRWRSWVMPHHQHLDCYTFTFSKLGVSAKYREISWEMDLRPDGTMTHEARRVVTI